ncbi:MAG TPA: GNAT family protein [Saprospiraceae bacterium]|nr:GNAT family protein [Saprospiraceae bacterium]HMP24213.1 GNAT family protein [Saprospiraceae bacterium]
MTDLQTDRFLLRRWRKGDLSALVKYANNQKIANFLRDGFPYPYTRKDGQQFLRMATRQDAANLMAIEMNAEAVGSIGFFRQMDIHRGNAEIGYWLAEPYWGQGIMSEAVALFSRYIFEQYDIIRLYAEVFATNRASQHVLERAGFEREAILKCAIIKNGILHDEVIYSRLRPDYQQFL